MGIILSGDSNNLPQELTEAEVNHLRRLLAWIRLEHALDEDMLRGYIEGATKAVDIDPDAKDRAQEIVEERVERIRSVPAYVRQAVKMLTKAVRDHDAKSRILDPSTTTKGKQK